MQRTVWGPVGGIVFVVLFVVGVFLLNLPVGGQGRSDETIRAFYAAAGNRTRVVVSVYVLAVAALAFLFFLADLYGTLRPVEPSSAGLPLVALLAGLIFVGMLAAAGAAFGSLAGGMVFGGEPTTLGDTGVARFLGQLGYGLILLYGCLAAALMVAVVSVVSLQTGIFPAWITWGGFVVALVLLAGVIFFPMLALPLWVLAVSVTRLQRGSGVADVRV